MMEDVLVKGFGHTDPPNARYYTCDGTRATTSTPVPFPMQLMLQSTDDFPINIGFTGKVLHVFSLKCLYASNDNATDYF
ncbi:urease isoform X3 [Canna indica]|uniref:Urease isoform X3 n=1 Tax=Canna indica TaxID=4628 RepID=A0AAQ3Q467_9LILI|nr:urease isoform X3 [Canna indica]